MTQERKKLDQQILLNSIEIDEKTDCWNWTKTKKQDGYGQVWHEGKMKRAHRVSFEVFKHPIPKGLFVLHKCDNPSCINPDHLFLGTHQDNADDRNQKQRQIKGERHHKAKLTETQVIHYKALQEAASFFIGGRAGRRLAREISGIPKTTADHIDSGRRWKSN